MAAVPAVVAQMNNVLASKTITKVADNLWLVPIESHSSDDEFSCGHWSHYEPAQVAFSPNITLVCGTYIFGGGAVIVSKKNPAVPETIVIHEPDSGKSIPITF